MMRYTEVMTAETSESTSRLFTQDAFETERLGETLALVAKAPLILAIDGELGAGKTQLVRGFARGMGLDAGEISSPTFVISSRHEGAIDLVHMDAYRIESIPELESIGFQEILQEDSLMIAIEWASRIFDALPEERLEVRIAHRSETTRAIEIIDRRSDVNERQRMSEALSDLFDATEVVSREDAACPSCGGSLGSEDQDAKPFCSTRCRLVDLGNWLGGGYTISRPMLADEELSD